MKQRAELIHKSFELVPGAPGGIRKCLGLVLGVIHMCPELVLGVIHKCLGQVQSFRRLKVILMRLQQLVLWVPHKSPRILLVLWATRRSQLTELVLVVSHKCQLMLQVP